MCSFGDPIGVSTTNMTTTVYAAFLKMQLITKVWIDFY